MTQMTMISMNMMLTVIIFLISFTLFLKASLHKVVICFFLVLLIVIVSDMFLCLFLLQCLYGVTFYPYIFLLPTIPFCVSFVYSYLANDVKTFPSTQPFLLKGVKCSQSIPSTFHIYYYFIVFILSLIYAGVHHPPPNMLSSFASIPLHKYS